MSEIVSELQARARARVRAYPRQWRVRLIGGIGPFLIVSGVLWAMLQPWRITLLHPYHQGFWWLVSEPPLYPILVGVLFHHFVARGLVEDLEESD